MRILVLLVASSLCSIGCQKKIPPAKEPLRPKLTKAEAKKSATEKTDCERVTVGDDKPAVKYEKRSIIEAENLANQGFDTLRAAEARGVPKRERERMVTAAVDDFITALLADPYNVHATYNLAAAYARIDRFQCSLNLLARLEGLRRLASQRAKVEVKLDRLFGRGKYRNNLDPDFDGLRDDRRFRKLAQKLQP